MKSVLSFKSLTLAVALLGGATALSAQTTVSEPVVLEPVAQGLLGSSYAHVGYGFIDLDDADVDIHSFKFNANQNIAPNLDTMLGYRYDRSESIPGGRATQHTLDVGARYFWTLNSNVRPYAEAGVGWAWAKGPFGYDEDSFLWFGGVGVEIAFAERWSITPLARYTHARNFDDEDLWEYGVKANWWMNERVGFQVSALEDDDKNMEYAAGVNFRF